MNPREYCSGSMDGLRASLEAFSLATQDAANTNSIWDDMWLNADALVLDFVTALTLEGWADPELRREIAALLQRAVDIIPGGVDPRVVEKLQDDIAEVLLSEAEDI